MSFLPLNKTWTTTFFLTLINTTKLCSWCIVWVKKEVIQVIEKKWEVCGECVKTLTIFPIMDGEIHDLDKDHSENQCKDALNRYALRVALMPSKWQSCTHT